MASGKSKTSFCIDSLLAQDKLPSAESSSAQQQAQHQQLIISGSYGDAIRFRSNLFGGLHHHHYPPSFETAKKAPGESDGENNKETDGRHSSNSSTKEEGTTNGDGQPIAQPSISCWTQPMSRMLAYAPPTSSGTQTVATSSGALTSTTSSASGGLSNYPSPLFTSPAAALHAAAAAAAAAVAASSPAAHQFHSAHLEWLARAGVLYHRFGGDLSG